MDMPYWIMRPAWDDFDHRVFAANPLYGWIGASQNPATIDLSTLRGFLLRGLECTVDLTVAMLVGIDFASSLIKGDIKVVGKEMLEHALCRMDFMATNALALSALPAKWSSGPSNLYNLFGSLQVSWDSMGPHLQQEEFNRACSCIQALEIDCMNIVDRIIGWQLFGYVLETIKTPTMIEKPKGGVKRGIRRAVGCAVASVAAVSLGLVMGHLKRKR